ncbi:MAG: hypothetical protein M1823_001437 [Watsoniomyces obsoletus]|nr:MAG: hypothetical protein M1823_001437 [Watsoniomyces obsoletus]
MHPLNPFLRAFFRSAYPSQCVPVQNHILLLPSTELLLTAWDQDSGVPYTELVGSDEFLGSHVLRIPPNAPVDGGRDGNATKEGRGKPKQYTTINGRTVVIKETFVYSNRGFKNLAQAQLLGDTLWYPDQPNAPQWLIYFISKPLIGSPETIVVPPALLPGHAKEETSRESGQDSSESGSSKKDIKAFNDLLNSFPMIARQMQPGLGRLFREFAKIFEKPLPSRPSQGPDVPRGSAASETTLVPDSASAKSGMSNGHLTRQISPTQDEETAMRRGLESIVTGSIDLFQLVDKQQLSLLGATTTVTGPVVERMIERYVAEQLHHSVLFPRLCAIKRSEDQELDSKMRQMENIDISQVGIIIPGGPQGKHEMLLRLDRGVQEFRKLGVAGSPHEMMEVLLATEKIITTTSDASTSDVKEDGSREVVNLEKPGSTLAMNADTLVSLLLVVVIRAQVRHLQTRLAYMRGFIFLDDVDAGEWGYALSTFEAVLSYLARGSAALRAASRKNKTLWEATKGGRIQELKQILEPVETSDDGADHVRTPEPVDDYQASYISPHLANGSAHSPGYFRHDSDQASSSTAPPLSHVFPFYNVEPARPPVTRGKRVSMDLQSMSSSSGRSFHSRTLTIESLGSAIEGDASIDRLSKTQNAAGESVLMMAIEHRQPEVLRYLLSLREYYPLEIVLGDCNLEGTTLMSAVVQTGHRELIEIMLDFILDHSDDQTTAEYFARPDIRGRTMAHYLFNAHHLIDRLGSLLPWRLRDKNGQTPLFALCRSYDHSNYSEMVTDAVMAAKLAQRDGGGMPLHLDEHVDNKGNTLLHIIHDRQLIRHLLTFCDSDVNATNDKRFTPLMVASKYGRVDLVAVFLEDSRVDPHAKEFRGLTAVELAKDDDVRNRIDDLILLSIPPDSEGRIAAVVRSYFLEDATIRLVVKTAVPSSTKKTVTITTSRRSLSDFENLANCLALEHPASWLPPSSSLLPSLSSTTTTTTTGPGTGGFRSPFQIPSRPSRAVLRDIQLRLDNFLRILLSHSTFSTHEMLWEFFLVPEILPEMMKERSIHKAEARRERVREEFPPVDDPREIEAFAKHARQEMRGVLLATNGVIRSVNRMKMVECGA